MIIMLNKFAVLTDLTFISILIDTLNKQNT